MVFFYCVFLKKPFNRISITIKARDQKQIDRLYETKSHWGLDPPPPGQMRHLKNWTFGVILFPMKGESKSR